MFTAEYKGINTFLVESSRLLLEYGISRKTRGFDCIELPEPFMFKITNPMARIVTIPERKWNSVLPYAESLWIASGRNDLSFMSHYLRKMLEFSDDGEYIRAGYGPRMRNFNGIATDYKNSAFDNNINHKLATHIDQFKYAYLSFQRDKNTRQAIITIGDPSKDCFDESGLLKTTKDYPCTRLLQFQKQAHTNKLNLTVYMRSNDLVWGASAVNIFNFTFIQEYFAQILGLEVGDYYHIANNFHYYKNFESLVKRVSEVSKNDIYESDFQYSKSFTCLESFEELLNKLQKSERSLRKGKAEMVDFDDEFFNDWYKVLYFFHHKNKRDQINFTHPLLNILKHNI